MHTKALACVLFFFFLSSCHSLVEVEILSSPLIHFSLTIPIISSSFTSTSFPFPDLASYPFPPPPPHLESQRKLFIIAARSIRFTWFEYALRINCGKCTHTLQHEQHTGNDFMDRTWIGSSFREQTKVTKHKIRLLAKVINEQKVRLRPHTANAIIQTKHTHTK